MSTLNGVRLVTIAIHENLDLKAKLRKRGDKEFMALVITIAIHMVVVIEVMRGIVADIEVVDKDLIIVEIGNGTMVGNELMNEIQVVVITLTDEVEEDAPNYIYRTKSKFSCSSNIMIYDTHNTTTFPFVFVDYQQF